MKHWWKWQQALLRRSCETKTNLEVSELGEGLAAVIESAEVWFGLIVNDLVGADVAALGEPLATDIACKWSVTGMSSLVGL